MSDARAKRLRIRERKLGRHRVKGAPVCGFCWSDGVIEIDPRQTAKEYLGTLLHELLHHILPGATEDWVEQSEKVLVNALWRKGYRRIAK